MLASLPLSPRMRRSWGAWAALFVLALDILVGTALPMVRAAQADTPISPADWVICSASGGAAPIGDDDPAAAKAQASILCALCLPLAQACLAPTQPPPLRGSAVVLVLRPPVVARVVPVVIALAFDARAPPPPMA